jgi:hypothetical protein
MAIAQLDNAPRCQHTKLNGQPCAAPARKGASYCLFHQEAYAERPDYSLAWVEDAVSLQFAVMQVLRALHVKAIDHKTASLTLYGLQIAALNLKRLGQENAQHADAETYQRQASLAELLLDQLASERAGLPNADENQRCRPDEFLPDFAIMEKP